ncbi:MAG: transporter substrate-binding domain-containing protein [Oscillospiraceae bacterium]|jgi:signal transduction histidine kinase/DNA-binding response OmpR family regulator|nr:transporter substrate-binding domain-containing protein [Oscillospiraceae bacterium]
MKKTKIWICMSLSVVIIVSLLSGCVNTGITETRSGNYPVFSSFYDIPGITEAEINAIEALAKEHNSFVFGATFSTESFITTEGDIGGFIALTCDWLTELFGIQFTPEIFVFSDLLAGLTAETLDFGILRDSEERRQTFFLTDHIGSRSIKIMRIEGSPPIPATRPPRYAFLEGSTTFDMVTDAMIPGSFEAVFAADYDVGYQMLQNGEADGFLEAGIAEAAFDIYPDVTARYFLPLLFNTVVMGTANQELEPIISVVTKALQSGSIHHLIELYGKGYQDYKRHKLFINLSEEEKAYLQSNPVVPFAASFDHYPNSFYNNHLQQWQGIAFDVLQEIEVLTGIKFEVVNDRTAEWFQLLGMLESGEAHVVAELIRTAEREGRFLWPENKLLTDQSALLSRVEFPDVDIHSILSMRVALVRDFAHAEMFRSWFPFHANAKEYNSIEDAFEAMAEGDVDLVMASYNLLLHLTHFQERPYYKANFVFDNHFESTFGFNIEQEILCSIIDKAMALIDTETISQQWLRKTYDYRIMLEQAQRPWIIGIAVVLALMTITVIVIIAERRKLESAELANRAKTNFLATMSHEIRTPMNSIMGFTELARDSDTIPKIKDFLSKITDSTDWLLHIVNDILDISKIEAGKMELEYAPFNLQDVFARCQSVVLPIVNEKGLDFNVLTETLPGKKLVGDQIRLYQAIMNILSNAVKFTKTGRVMFSSNVKVADNGNATVYFEIKDDGIGMTPAQAKRVFDPFIQADSSTTRSYGGTGLGLAITKNIVELMGGKIKVESTLGIGSTFSFELVFETVESDDDFSDRKDFILIEKPNFDNFILVCDDNPMNQEVVCEYLSRVGIQAALADNGEMGVDMVTSRIQNGEKPFDLIFMDMFMPVMDGMEAAAKIIALDTGTPIVAMTANVMSSELEKYKKIGMTDCLGKPFTSQELWRVLLKYLKPVSIGSIDNRNGNDELHKKLCVNFLRNNQNIHKEITDAVTAGENKLAHRLAHTLKGNAGMIGKIELKNAAADVEALLIDDGTSVLMNKMNILESALTRVLNELKLLHDDSPAQTKIEPLSDTQTAALFAKLEDMLDNANSECVMLINELQAVPGAAELIKQIEDYNFETASELLQELKKQRDH